MKKTQKLKIKKSKAQIQQMKDIYTKALEEDMEYLKHMGDRLFELKFTDVNSIFQPLNIFFSFIV